MTEAVSHFESGRIDTVVVGIGINYHVPDVGFPEELKETAGVVCPQNGKIPRNTLAAYVIQELYELYEGLSDKTYMEDYRKWSNVLGREVRFTSGTEWEYGMAVDIDEDGGLIVEMKDGTKQVLRTGEITLRVC